MTKKIFVRLICKQCQLEFETHNSQRQFCCTSCRLKWEHANGIRKVGFDPHKSTYELWCEKYGQQYADELMIEYRKKMSSSILNADMTHQKEVARENRIKYNLSLKGKTLEEIYGEERAKEIRTKLSITHKGKRNSAYGKIYMNGGKSVKGYYKGLFFRSLLEYSFMKYLETQKIDIHNDVEYEKFHIPYVLNGNERTYTIDFYVKSQNVAYEVKQSYVVKNPQNNSIKWNAAKNFFLEKGIQFQIITEKEFPKIQFDVANEDSDVTWIEKTLTFFKRK